MKDLIERQKAIDALTRKMVSIPTAGEKDLMGDVNRIRAEDISVIRRLPSAQPEIVRCGQCKYAEVTDAQDNQDGYTCQFHRGSIWFSGSYCSWGERRTDG